MSRRRSLAAAAAVAVLAGLAAADTVAARTYKKGQVVVIAGRVTDASGVALPEVTVLLEVARSRLTLPRFRRQIGNVLQVASRTDGDGSFTIEWPWDPFYNTFAVIVALPKIGGTGGYETFARKEITEQVENGSPVAASMVVPDASVLKWVRQFESGMTSEDERRVYAEMGRPDRLDSRDTDDGTEHSWWYFEAGKVFRFVAGRLDQVVHFDPVEPL